MHVPFLNLKAQYESMKGEIDTAIKNVIDDTAFIKGPYVASFEKNFANYIGTKHCIGVANCTDALAMTLKCLGVGAGDEVIIPANTFVATAGGVAMTGARPVFVDNDPETYNIDTTKIEAAITERTKAIIPVHLHGGPADMDAVRRIAESRSLFVIEDAAQAHGATYKGKKIGTLGDAACFSFYPSKNLGAYGDAGAITTNDDALAEKIRMYRDHGRKDKFNHETEGVNSRLDGLQAAILDAKLKHLDAWTKRKQEIAKTYNKELEGIVITPKALPEAEHVYHLYVIQVENRDEARQKLEDAGIGTGTHYPIPLPYLGAYKHMGHTPEDFPVAYAQKDKLLSLPMYAELTDDHVQYVIDKVKKAVHK